MLKKFLKGLKKNDFEKDFQDLIPKDRVILKEESYSFRICAILDRCGEFNSTDLDSTDTYFVKLISELKEFYEGVRVKLGSDVMKNPSLVELNQLIFALTKNKELLYRDEFNLEEFVKYQQILLSQIRKL